MIFIGATLTRPKSKNGLKGKIIFWFLITSFLNTAIIPILQSGSYEVNYIWYKTVGLSLLSNLFIGSLQQSFVGFLTPNVMH